MLKIFGIQQVICEFSPDLDFIGILLFYCLKTMENNRKTMKPIEIVKNFLIDVIPLWKLIFWQSLMDISKVVHILQLFQLFATCTVIWP